MSFPWQVLFMIFACWPGPCPVRVRFGGDRPPGRAGAWARVALDVLGTVEHDGKRKRDMRGGRILKSDLPAYPMRQLPVFGRISSSARYRACMRHFIVPTLAYLRTCTHVDSEWLYSGSFVGPWLGGSSPPICFFEVVNRTVPETQEPMPFSGLEVSYRVRDIDARFGEMVESWVVLGCSELLGGQGRNGRDIVFGYEFHLRVLLFCGRRRPCLLSGRVRRS